MTVSLPALTEPRLVREAVSGPSTLAGAATALEQLAPGSVVSAVTLDRCTFKPNRVLRAGYTAVVDGRPWPIALTWRADGADGLRTSAAHADGFIAPTRVGPFEGGPGRVEGIGPSGASAQAWPIDDHFDQLEPTVEHHLHVGDSVDAIRYRPGQRHVLSIGRDGAAPVYLKLDPGGMRRRVDVALDLVATETVDARSMLVGPIASPSPVPGSIAYPAAPGRPLVAVDDPRLRAKALGSVGRLAAEIHRIHPGPGTVLPTRSWGEELALVERACQHLVHLAPDLATAVSTVLGVARDEVDPEPDGHRLVHGDLKLEHLFASGDRLRVIDLDSFRLADPASDLAKLTAELHYLAAVGGHRSPQCSIVALLDGYRSVDPARAEHVLARVARLEPALLLKMAARRVSPADASWRIRVGTVVAEALRLSEEGPWRVAS